MDSFVAIDFETAAQYRNRACAVGIVTVEEGRIVEEFYSLIQPPGNRCSLSHISIHNIHPGDTRHIDLFPGMYPEIKKRLEGRLVVAHNKSFDRSVLKA